MKCAACEQDMVKKVAELDLRVNNKLHLVRNVELEECENCGERVIDPAVSERIFDMINARKYHLKAVDLPVLELASI